jgi:hypothetical protein
VVAQLADGDFSHDGMVSQVRQANAYAMIRCDGAPGDMRRGERRPMVNTVERAAR